MVQILTVPTKHSQYTWTVQSKPCSKNGRECKQKVNVHIFQQQSRFSTLNHLPCGSTAVKNPDYFHSSQMTYIWQTSLKHSWRFDCHEMHLLKHPPYEVNYSHYVLHGYIQESVQRCLTCITEVENLVVFKPQKLLVVWYVSFEHKPGHFSNHGHGRAGVDSVNVEGLRYLDCKGHKIPVRFTSKVTKHGKRRAGKMGGGIGEMEGWVENRCSLGSSMRLPFSWLWVAG